MPSSPMFSIVLPPTAEVPFRGRIPLVERGGFIRKWLPVGLRLLVVSQLALPALSKVFAYSRLVEDFTEWGIPAPEVMVIVVAFFELAAMAALLLGVAGRMASAPVVVIMVVAMVSAAPNLANGIVLVGCLGIIALGTGALSLWTPEDQLLASGKA